MMSLSFSLCDGVLTVMLDDGERRQKSERLLGQTPSGPPIKAMGKGPNQVNAEISGAGRFWRVS
jgi:hypothetical protein